MKYLYILTALILMTLVFSCTQASQEQPVAEKSKVEAPAPAIKETATTRGDDAFMKGDYSAALGFFKSALDEDPKNADAHIGVAISLAELGKLEEAHARFTKSIEAMPEVTAFYINRGEVSNLMDKQDEACSDWKTACDMDECKRLDIAILKGKCDAALVQ